jgi:hypothetical protein
MHGFVEEIVSLLKRAGLKSEEIFTGNRKATLPGFFRPTKDWDIVVIKEGSLVAAIEMKSQTAPSFGNNANNRAEEAVGNAEDAWTAFREGAFGTQVAPWLGYLFLLEDDPRSRRVTEARSPHYEVFPEFREWSYVSRYRELCERLILERKYTATCLLLSERARSNARINYTEPSSSISAKSFLESLARHAGRF